MSIARGMVQFPYCIAQVSIMYISVLTIRSAEGQDFIIKNLLLDDYEYQKALQKPLSSCPNLRTVLDGLPGPELFIYLFLQTDFLQFTQKNLTDATRKSMLKSALAGLAAMHDQNIIHTGKLLLRPLIYVLEILRYTFMTKHLHIYTLADQTLADQTR